MKTTIDSRLLRVLATALMSGWLSSSGASAGDSAPNLSMKIFSDVPGGPEIMATEYARAIRIMEDVRGDGEERILISHNLCVAYTLDRAFNKARLACNNAVQESDIMRNYGDWFTRYASFRKIRGYKSRAFANRATLRHLLGDAAGAAKDQDRAIALDSRSYAD